MPIEMPRGLPFSVDTWTPSAASQKRHHFLTHAHRDHLAGVTSAARSWYPIYCTRITKILAQLYFPQLHDSLFVEIKVGETITINDPDGAFTALALDANHCPGAVMFLFEGEFGNVLHTGDCRLTPDCLQYLPLKYRTKKGKEAECHIDYLFLDCTFGRCPLKLPSKHTAVQQVMDCIWKHPSAPAVYLACDLLGQEEILVEVCKTFGSKIYVDKSSNSECFRVLSHLAPDILSHDANSRFQLIEGFPRLSERATDKVTQARAAHKAEPLFVRPSAQWYANNERLVMTQEKKPTLTEAERDEFGIWHVCYSMHSSREELEWALALVRPKWVISTTPPCRAMELDYVKKHCFKTRINHDDPLWKLLKVDPGKPITSPSQSAIQGPTSPDCKEELEKFSLDSVEIKLESSPTVETIPITLFGRARLGFQDADAKLGDNRSSKCNESESKVELATTGEVSSLSETTYIAHESSVSISEIPEAHQVLRSEKSASLEKQTEKCASDMSSTLVADREGSDVRSETYCIGSSKSINASLRKLYRSRNIPVPRPLPSLVDLIDVSKRIKLSSTSGLNI